MAKNKNKNLYQRSMRGIGWVFTEKNRIVQKEFLTCLKVKVHMMCGGKRRKVETIEEITKVKIVVGEEVEVVVEEEMEIVIRKKRRKILPMLRR